MAMVMGSGSSLLLSLAYLLCVYVAHVTSLSFDYNFSIPGVLTSADIKYMSDASGGSDRIDLTNDTIWSTGRVAYRQPVQLWDDAGKVASFTSNFTFAIKPHNSTNQADGMAFYVGPWPPNLPGDSTGGFLGLFNNPNNPANTVFPPTVAVEFDAFRNDGWDPNNTANHLGVDVNNITSRAYMALPAGSFNGTMSAWVRYDADMTTLSATLRFDDLPELGLYNVSAIVDFKDAGLPPDAAVGFSGATGDFIERHQILSWSFESTLTGVVVNETRKCLSLFLALFHLLYIIFRYVSRKKKGKDTSRHHDFITVSCWSVVGSYVAHERN